MSDNGVTDLEVQRLRERERLLCRLRHLAALLVLGMAVVFDPLTRTGAVLLAGLAFGASVYEGTRLSRVRDLAGARRLRTRALLTDTALALVTFVFFAPDPEAMPIALFPFLVFRLAVHHGFLGAFVGVLVFLGALVLRVHMQTNVFDDGQLRPPLLLLWCSLVVLLIAFSREVRVHESLRKAAFRERQRIANGFRETIETALARSGIPADAPSAADVHAALREMCEDRTVYRRALANQIAELLASTSSNLGLTRRELEILELLGQGHSYTAIASELFVSGSTVRNHVHNIKRKLMICSSAELVQFASDRVVQRGSGAAGVTGRENPSRRRSPLPG